MNVIILYGFYTVLYVYGIIQNGINTISIPK